MKKTKPTTPKASVSKERLAYLEEAYRHTLESLEMAASLGIPEGVKPLGTEKQILDETASRLKKLLKFKAMAFFLVREPGGDFYLARCYPPQKAVQMEEELRVLVESGSAAWALQRRRPVFTTPSVAGEQLLLHSMATASRIRGMFVGLLGEDIKNISDASLTLCTIVLRGCASLMEGLQLYALLRHANSDLKTKVKDLEESQRSLKREIERRIKVEEALKHQALHDPLTSLPNRTLMLDRVQQAIRRSLRRETSYYALAYMDLDKFKLINDTLGHDAGDKLLVRVGVRILESVRQHDTVARFGGDEFVIFLEEISLPGEAVRVLKRVRQALAAPMDIDGHPVSVTGSFGLVFGPVRQATPDKLLKQANTAMHMAKEAGRNRVKVFSDKLRGMVRTQASILADLRRAVEAGRSDVLYSPLYSMADEPRFIGFEAVPVWEHKGKANSGGELMEMASREGVAWSLWLATLGKALTALGAWKTEAPDAESAMVSLRYDLLSPPQSDLAETVLAMLANAGLPGDALGLEISENVLASGGEYLAAQLTRLKQAGVRLTACGLGDRFFSFQADHPAVFGSLRINPSTLPKGSGENAGELAGALVSLAKALGMDVLAAGTDGVDGMETPELLGGSARPDMLSGTAARPLTAGQARAMLLANAGTGAPGSKRKKS